jgi:pyroglutamyl-peptidase
VEVRHAPPPCEFEGDLDGKKVLLTGFQPFPADARHENISWVAVSSLDPLALPGTQIMRLQLPVEYDRAAAEIASAVERCQPDLVVSFGQGGSSIHLEETAYNLKDTAEIAGGVPDNRGVVFAGQPIDERAPDTRGSLLPLAEIQSALEAAGESPRFSDDPGRYICNNVFFTIAGLGVPAGFVHLPYEDDFPDATRARWGRVVETVVQASLR